MSFFRFRLRQICAKDLYFCKLYYKRLKSLNQGKTVFAQIMAHTKKLILQVHKDHKKAIV